MGRKNFNISVKAECEDGSEFNLQPSAKLGIRKFRAIEKGFITFMIYLIRGSGDEIIRQGNIKEIKFTLTGNERVVRETILGKEEIEKITKK